MTFPNNTKNIKLYANEHGDPDLDDSTTFDSQEDAEWVTTLDKGGPMSFRSLLLSLTTATITLTAAAVGANPYYSNLNTTIPIFVGLHHAFVAAIFMDKIQIFEVGRITCKSPVLPPDDAGDDAFVGFGLVGSFGDDLWQISFRGRRGEEKPVLAKIGR
ncbi:hypothetical protein WG66_006435 [Moniliophthora roreri]|nr:hypothetical protein WG66_006435 [Moniliophthora roreri]